MIVYTSPFVLPEWIAAHGLRPWRVIPHATRKAAQMGMCPFAQAFRETVQASDAAGAIFVSTCDQMRRAPEGVPDSAIPVFELDMPATWQSDAAFAYYADELRRLGQFLLNCGGTTPEKAMLVDTILRYERLREALYGLADTVDRRVFTEVAAALHAAPENALPARTKVSASGPPVAFVGSALLQESLRLYDMLEGCGARIALDATALGERAYPAVMDRDALRKDPFDTMAAAYFMAVKAAFRRPNDRLYAWLDQWLRETGCRGIVFHSYAGCDIWHAEVERLRACTQLPVLALLQSIPNQPEAHTLNRIEAFVETLR